MCLIDRWMIYMTEDEVCVNIEAVAETNVGQDQRPGYLAGFFEDKYGRENVDFRRADERGSRSHMICVTGVEKKKIEEDLKSELEKESDHVSALSKALSGIGIY